jgi:LCP family protein required for cell wall assembly
MRPGLGVWLGRRLRVRPAAIAAAGVAVSLAATSFAAQLPPAAPPLVEIHATASARFAPSVPGVAFALIVGNDYRPGVSGKRADALHLVALNAKAGAATVLNIPRDTWVNIPGRGNNRINVAHTFGGPALQAAAVEGLTGIRPDVTIVTDFAGFVGLVNALGGVSVDIAEAHSDAASEAFFSPGRQHLSGKQALALSRNRHLPGGDFTRTANQGRIIVAGLAELRAKGRSLADVARYLTVLLSYTTVDGMDPVELFHLGRAAMAVDPAKVTEVTMPGRVGQAGTASVVLPTAAAAPLFADIADDGLVNQSS